jgi:predicted transposase YbfD/YdcC
VAARETIRITQHDDARETTENRYYIGNRCLSVKRFSEAVRKHWEIESMHWMLDVHFREDENRTRERMLTNNMSWLRRFAITLLKRHSAKEGINGRMKIAGWNPDFLAEVLTLQQV